MKNQVDEDLMTLFGDDEWFDTGPAVSEDDYRTVKLVAPASRVRDRLDIMGFTRAATVAVFEEGRQGIIANLKERLADVDAPQTAAASRRQLSFYEELSFGRWLALLGEARSYFSAMQQVMDLRSPDFEDLLNRFGVSALARFFLHDDREMHLGFPIEDPRYIVRGALEWCAPSAEVVYDLSDLVDGGWLEVDSSLEERGEPPPEARVSIDRKLIVLTEGHSDVVAIRGALSVVYPHLVDYVTFMDFDLSNAAGGASQLVSIIKAFAGTGIPNRIVAVFDNDTAATVALRGLAKTKLPDNIRVLQLPSIDSARSYPTIGPAEGLVSMDVNGLAGSIELYFGREVLRGDSQDVMPVQWYGYDQSVRRYQGELINKTELRRRFDAKVARCIHQPDGSLEDWADMRVVLDCILHAFE